MKRYSHIAGNLILVLILVCITSKSVLSQDTLNSSRSIEKIQYIQTALDNGRPGARLWWYGWITTCSVLAAGQFTMAGMASNNSWPGRDNRVNCLVGGTKSTLALAMLLVVPFTPAYASDNLAVLPQVSDDEIKLKLSESERLLGLSARKERLGRSWLKHAAAFIVNAAGGIIVWQFTDTRDSWKKGILNFATGMAIAEAMIWTQPMEAQDDFVEYQRKYSNSRISYQDSEGSDFYVSVYPGGFVMGRRF